MIAHIVLFEPKPSIDTASKRLFAQTVVESLRSIASIKRVRIGRSVSVDPGYDRSMGDTTYQFAAILEFEDHDALMAYLTHPRHQELGRTFWLNCDRTVISEVEMADPHDESVVDLLAG